jgi:hypothetical protein
MPKPRSESFLVAGRGEPRTRTALVLESIALRHQIAVLERSGTRRPCFRRLESAVLDLVLALVAPMAQQLAHRPARDGLALAPRRLVSALAISSTGALARWATQGFQGSPPADRADGPSELFLGCATDPWRRTPHLLPLAKRPCKFLAPLRFGAQGLSRPRRWSDRRSTSPSQSALNRQSRPNRKAGIAPLARSL